MRMHADEFGMRRTIFALNLVMHVATRRGSKP